MSGGVDSSVTAALLVEQGYEVTACRCACGRASRGRGYARIIAARRKSPSIWASPIPCSICASNSPTPWSSRLPRIICTAARPIPAWRAIAISNSARCCAGPRSRARITSPPVIMPGIAQDSTNGACVVAARCRRRQRSVLFSLRIVAGAIVAHAVSAGRDAQDRGARESPRSWIAGGGTSGEPGYLLRRLQSFGGDLRRRERVRRRRGRRPCR